MAWKVNYTGTALKQLGKLDKQIAKRIVDFMDQRISVSADPRDAGKALLGATFGAFWRYRVGDYRIVCDIQDNVLCVLVVQIGNRKEVYEKR